MTPHSDADAPSIDRGVAARLRRLDPNLVLTWHRYYLDPLAARPIITRAGEPVEYPSWHLWRRDDNTNHHHWIGDYVRFGQREVASLERDLARFYSPSEILRRMSEQRSRTLARQRQQAEDIQKDKLAANEHRIHDLVFGGKDGTRDAKTFSYAGQRSRATPGRIQESGEADGWELPENPQGE